MISFYRLEVAPSIVAAMFITLEFATFHHFAAYIALRITSRPKIKLIQQQIASRRKRLIWIYVVLDNLEISMIYN